MREPQHRDARARADEAHSARRTAVDVEPGADADVADRVVRVTLRRRLRLLPIGVTAAFVAFDLWLLPRSTLIISPANYLATAKTVTTLLVALVGGALVRRRFRNDATRTGAFVRAMADREIVFANAALVFAIFTAVAALFMFLASNTTAPLVDGQLAAADAAIGFDWPTWLGRTNAVAHLPAILAFAYGTTGPVLAGLLACLCFTRPEERVLELIALVTVTSLCTGILMYLLPAAGAYIWFHPQASLFDAFPTGAGVWHYRILSELRSGEPFTYEQGKAVGLVTFPSFHTILAIITTYAARGLRVVFPALVVLNATMIVSTVPYGGHYLVDVLAGAVIAVVCIAAVRAIGGSPAE